VDIAIRLIRKGYKIGFSEKAVAETNMPCDVKGFLRQRQGLQGNAEYIKKTYAHE